MGDELYCDLDSVRGTGPDHRVARRAGQKAVTLAANQIEQRLKRDPLGVGESRESSINRVVFLSPLAVAYDVVEDDKVVFIRLVQFIN